MAWEPLSRQRARELTRELWDASQVLGAAEQRESTHSVGLLHREGVLIGLRELCQAPAGTADESVWHTGSPLLLGRFPSPESFAAAGVAICQGLGGVDATQLEALRVAHETVLLELETELNRAWKVHTRSWLRISAIGLAAALAVILTQRLVSFLRQPGDLASGKGWKASSVWADCTLIQGECGGEKTRVFFYTREEMKPWWQVDLGEPQEFSRLTVVNRSDMALERAVPLVAEVSDDGTHFREVARRNESFAVWKPDLGSQRARFLRLRVDRYAALHLEAVKVHR